MLTVASDHTFVVGLVLFAAAVWTFLLREIIHQRSTRRPPRWLTGAACVLTGAWAAAVVWRFEVLA